MITDLETTARRLLAPGKGILAMDESNPTCGKRLAEVGVDNTETQRRDYRELLLSAPGLEAHISGAILYDETLRQSSRAGEPFVRLMERRGLLPGIKVDTGAKPLAGHPGETVTEGLDGLRERLAGYRELGARFCKWRAVLDPALASRACLDANAHALARYAALCQETGLLPIVEPEVLMDGDHDIDRCHAVTEATLVTVFRELRGQGVLLEGIILKASMVLPGRRCPVQADVATVARATVRCLRRTVPAAVPGVAFLSGGQADAAATAHLDAMNRLGGQPWVLSFSYGRALQAPALAAWLGQAEQAGRAQAILRHRAACNGAAALGAYDPTLERACAA